MRTAVLLTFVVASVAALPASNPEPATRIVDGKEAERYQFPYSISAQTYNLHICGGAIISPTAILTAAHCFYDGQPVTVVAGLLDQEEDHPDNQAIPIVERIRHPDYVEGDSYNDIAILKLAHPLTFSEAVQPIPLAEPGDEALGQSVVSGWGIYKHVPSSYAIRLQYLETPIITNEECNRRFAENGGYPFEIIDTQLCTLPNRAGQSTCHGDSGSPLAQNGKLVGLVKGGSRYCGSEFDEESPNIYNKVSPYLDFIRQHVTDL